MALIECPDCSRKLSDRAKCCPDCACPVAEVVEEQRAEARRLHALETREHLEREVDCPTCEGQGVYKCSDGYAEWCVVCEHTGRIQLCKASDGYYAVAAYAVERFLAKELMPGSSGVVFFLGEKEPKHFRFGAAGERHEIDPDDIPW